MSTKVSMAIAEEHGTPDHESLVAHCTLEFDDESSSPKDNEVLQQAVHSALAACCQSVYEELPGR
jgi:hypothetical protein